MKTTVLAFLLLIATSLVGAQDETPKVTKPVPVVPPQKEDTPIKKKEKKEDKEKDSPPSAVEETSGTLPLTFVKNKIETMPVGTKAYVSVDSIKADSKRRVWLDPDQVYGTSGEGRVVLVNRDVSGYSITLEKVDHQWVCQELPTGTKWIAVKSVLSK